MRNEWSRIRIKHKVPGSMLNKKLGVGIPFIDNSGKRVVHDMWMHHVEYQLEEQFADEKNNLIMFGRSNRDANGEYTDFGKSGNVIKMGARYRDWETDRKSTRLNSSHSGESRMPSSA